MTDNDHLSENQKQTIREEALREARGEMEQEIKMEILDILHELLGQLWERLAGLMGDAATGAIFASAKWEASREHPFLEEVEVDAGGVHLTRVEERLSSLDRETIKAGFLSFMDSVVALITDLTGDILMRKVEPLVQEFREHLEEE